MNCFKSEIYRFVKSRGNVNTFLIVSILLYAFSIFLFEKFVYSDYHTVNIMGNVYQYNDPDLNTCFHMVMEPGFLIMFYAFPFILFKSKVYLCQDIYNQISEFNRNRKLVLSNVIFDFIYSSFIIIVFSLIVFILSILRYHLPLDFMELFLFLAKSNLCFFTYLLILDTLIDFTKSYLYALLIHFFIAFGFYDMFFSGICIYFGKPSLIYSSITFLSGNITKIDNIFYLIPVVYVVICVLLKYIRLKVIDY